MKDNDAQPTTTNLPVETKMLIECALFHFWNCDGGCGMLHSAMAKLAAHVGYESYPGQAKSIAAYDGKRLSMTMEIDDVQS